MSAEALNKAFVYLSCKNHLDYIHCFLIGNTHTVYKLAFLACFFEHLAYFGAAAVYQNNVHTYKSHKNNIAHNCTFQFRTYHSISAVFYYYCFSCKFLNIRQSLHKYMCSFFVGNFHYINSLPFLFKGCTLKNPAEGSALDPQAFKKA